MSGQLAAHYEKAGLPAQAVDYYQQAAQRSLRTYANHEAIEHLNRGLALLAGMPDNAGQVPGKNWHSCSGWVRP